MAAGASRSGARPRDGPGLGHPRGLGGEDGHTGLLPDHLQLGDGVGPLEVGRDDDGAAAIMLHADVRLTRSGNAMRLVQGNGLAAVGATNPSLIKLVVKARRWWSVLREGQVDITTLATREGVKAPYMTRVLRLVFLSPAVIDAILAGRQSGGTTVTELTLGHGVPASWDQQKLALLPAS